MQINLPAMDGSCVKRVLGDRGAPFTRAFYQGPSTSLQVCFMSATPVLAAASSGGAGTFIIQFVPLILIFVIFWFLLIRPQQKRMKDHRDMIAALKKGDRVVTGGGLLGRVTKVNDEEVEIDLGSGQKVTALKATLSDVRNPNAAND